MKPIATEFLTLTSPVNHL